MKTTRPTRRINWRVLFPRRRKKHDPLLVLNLAEFNFADGWDRVFNPLKTHERGT